LINSILYYEPYKKERGECSKIWFLEVPLYRELVSEIRRRVVPVRPNREVTGKTYLKNHISITTTNRTVEREAGGEQVPAVLVS
jgi:hypothetical protein